MIGERQKCAEPPGAGDFLGLYTTPQQLSGGGGRFLGVCTMNKLLHTGVWQQKTHLLQIHHQQHKSPFAVQE